MIELISINELRNLFRPNRLPDFIRTIADSVLDLFGIEHNIRLLNIEHAQIQPVVINYVPPVVHIPDINITPPINPVLIDVFFQVQPFLEEKPKLNPELQKAMDDIFNQKPRHGFSLIDIKPKHDTTFYATETPGVFSNQSPF